MEVSKPGDLINEIKNNPSIVDKLLYPGDQLSDFDETKLKLEVLPSGFPSFDEKFLFKRGRGELIIIGARPSIGKSALGFQLAMSVAEYGKAHIFSLEMEHESIAARQMASMNNWPLDYIQTNGVTDKELQRAREKLSKLNCIIDDRASLNVNQICDAARMQNKKQKTDVVVIDYVQIIATDNESYSRAIALGEVSTKLKELAKELRIPVILLSQLNRNSEFRDAKTPQLSDLKESGQLEQDADIVILLHRDKDAPNTALAIVAKNRNGPTGDIPLEFAGAQCRFIDKKGSSLD